MLNPCLTCLVILAAIDLKRTIIYGIEPSQSDQDLCVVQLEHYNGVKYQCLDLRPFTKLKTNALDTLRRYDMMQ